MDNVQFLYCFVLVSSIGKCIKDDEFSIKFHAQTDITEKPKWYSYFLQLYNFVNILARLNDLQIGINILKLTLI